MKHCIYTLTNPLNGKIFYVGRAINLEKRLKQHINESKKSPLTEKKDTILTIISKKSMPIIEIIEEIEGSDSFSEEYWIHQLKSWGFSLTNIKGMPVLYDTYHLVLKEWLTSVSNRLKNIIQDIKGSTMSEMEKNYRISQCHFIWSEKIEGAIKKYNDYCESEF